MLRDPPRQRRREVALCVAVVAIWLMVLWAGVN